MKFAPQLCLIVSIAALFPACSSGDTKNSNQTNQTANTANANIAAKLKYDVEELEMTVKLPFHPEEAVWHEDVLGKPDNNRAPAPTDKKLTAVLRFLKEDAEKITAQAQTYKPANAETINTESWFPAELIAQSQTSGDETLKGQTYAANDFYNMPYTDGKLTRIEGTDYFILELFAK